MTSSEIEAFADRIHAMHPAEVEPVEEAFEWLSTAVRQLGERLYALQHGQPEPERYSKPRELNAERLRLQGAELLPKEWTR